MQSFKNYITRVEENNDITYNEYCLILEIIGRDDNDDDDDEEEYYSLNEDNIYSLIDYTSEKAIFIYKRMKRDIASLSKQLNITKKAIIIAFIDPTIFNILKAFKFSIKTLLKVFSELGSLIRTGLFDALNDISRTAGVEKIDDKLVHIDDYLEKYPILKKVTGPILAAMIIFIWLNMTFIGNFKYDMNLSAVVDAARGKLTLGTFLASKEGKALLILFGTGSFVSSVWLVATSLNLILAMVYTGLLANKKYHLLDEIKSKIKRQ